MLSCINMMNYNYNMCNNLHSNDKKDFQLTSKLPSALHIYLQPPSRAIIPSGYIQWSSMGPLASICNCWVDPFWWHFFAKTCTTNYLLNYLLFPSRCFSGIHRLNSISCNWNFSRQRGRDSSSSVRSFDLMAKEMRTSLATCSAILFMQVKYDHVQGWDWSVPPIWSSSIR